MNNGVNNSNTTNTTPVPSTDNPRETIEAAKVYKLEKPIEEKETPKEEVKQETVEATTTVEKPKKKKNILARLFFLVILGLIGYIVFQDKLYTEFRDRLTSRCTPVSTIKEQKELDVNSTFVQGLYRKVKTSIVEDLVESELNLNMKLYLAYRQVPQASLFKSTCDGFDPARMVPYTCDSNNFEPFVFKKEDLKIQFERLFGEDEYFEYGNIQIGKGCIGGYEYVESRGEYVQGTCKESTTTTFKAKKELTKAISKQSTIYLKEDVRYSASEALTLPSHLKSGTYVYVFKLDKNYNYIYLDKYLEEEV